MLYEEEAERPTVSIQYRQHPLSTAVALEVTRNIGLPCVRSSSLSKQKDLLNPCT